MCWFLSPLHPLRIEARALAGAVTFQRTLLARRVRALKDPVLPGAEAAEDAGLHGLRPGEAQIGLEPGQRVGRKARPLVEREADFVVPINVVIARGDEAQRLGLPGIERRADALPRVLQAKGLAEKAGRQPGETVAHCIGAKIERR